jgi:uracil-DNA glycosylase
MLFDIPESWQELLSPALGSSKTAQLARFLEQQTSNGLIIYPERRDVFNALKLTKPKDVRVVILGQDPYHGVNQAHGLAFSVPKTTPIPPSLRNIFKELVADLNLPTPQYGNLEGWATQGVLLLNSVLTVEAGKAGSHQNQGWEGITDHIIVSLNEHKTPIVFMLWGAYAAQKRGYITNPEHLIIQSAHPSPLSCHRGFFGSKQFSKANDFLKERRINWNISQ